uniref:Ankyrin repeat and FYVE domain-containing protein 1 n=1 Tax=Ciona savignyi TaxID=51511 RepID=H2YXH3_CIOSA
QVNDLNFFFSDELSKTRQHLSLLREQYVKLQLEHAELQRSHSALKALQSNEVKATPPDHSLASGLLHITTKLFGNDLYSDIEIKLAHKSIPGHKFVLAARGAMCWDLNTLNTLSVLDLQNLDQQAGEAIVRWLYTDTVNLTDTSDDFIIQMMKTSSKYNLHGLLARCEQAIMSVVTVKNCIRFYELAEDLKAASLKDYCSSLVSMHWHDLSPQEFSFMAAPMLYTMLKSKSQWPLHRAIRARREDVVFLYLIEFDSQLNERNDDGEWPIQLALSTHQDSIARTLVSHRVDINGCDNNGQTHLHRAVIEGDGYTGMFLLDYGANVNMSCRADGNTGLHLVSSVHFGPESKHDMDSITRLTANMLKKGGNPNLPNALGLTPLHLSIQHKNMPVFKLLLDYPETDMEIRTRDGHPSLWLALDSSNDTSVVYHDHSMAALLIKQGCNVDSPHPNTGSSLLQLCMINSNETGGLFLAKHRGNVNHINSKGESPLHISCLHGLIQLTECLLAKGIFSQILNNGLIPTHAYTSLHVAIRCQHHEVVQLFLEHRANTQHSKQGLIATDFSIQDSNSNTVLALAVWSGFYKVAAQLLSSGADINYKNAVGRTLLHQAIEKKDISSSLFLLEHQADCHARSGDDETALEMGVKQGLAVVVDALCLRGADVDISDAAGDPLLWIALQNGMDDIASTLVHYRCNTTKWRGEHNLLHRAIADKNERIACFLIRSGCETDTPAPPMEGVEGQTPMHMASQLDLQLTLEALLERNARINAQDSNMQTPLHLAVVNNHLSITSTLLTHTSINLTLVDNMGRTPFASAMHRKNVECAKLILKRDPGAAEQMDKNGLNFLHSAIVARDLDSILFLISIGSDVNSLTCNTHQSSALHLAVGVGDVLIVRNLLLAGAHTAVVDKHKQSALHVAAVRNPTIAGVLVENGADVGHVDLHGNNVFHVACKHGSLETLSTLTQALPNLAQVLVACNNRGQTVLHVMAEDSSSKTSAMFDAVMRAMPDYPLAVQDNHGNTALLLAYMNGNGSLCRSLVRTGSSLAITNNDGVNLFNHPVATKQLLFRLLDLLSQEPPWAEGNSCLECGVRFGVATRKHHCRHCGRILCSKCSSKIIPILKFDVSKPTRVCDLCYDVLTLGAIH